MKKFNLLLVLLFIANFIFSQSILPYKNSDLPIDTRVNDLLNRMTQEEKFWQLFMLYGELETGKEDNYKNGIMALQLNVPEAPRSVSEQIVKNRIDESALLLANKINLHQKYFIEKTRLGIPMVAVDEALHGIVRGDGTTFPQSIALAATWDTLLMRKVATAVAKECRLRGIRQILSPVINIASDVRWGRTEETYGEDPLLSAAMGFAFIHSFEQLGVITTPKHFVANAGDGGRDSYPIYWTERLLEEIHYPPFKTAFKQAGARSVMTSYNSLDGLACTANNDLLIKKLKDEWGFKGFVISDAGAVGGANVLHNTAKDYPESTTQAINGGLDVIFQTDYYHYKLFQPAFFNGSIAQTRVDDAVARVLRAKFELGLFENPYIDEKILAENLKDSTHRKLSMQAAVESFVLLKNEKVKGKNTAVLPLSKNISSITIIGKDAVEARLGGYSGKGVNKIPILEGIKNIISNKTSLTYVPGPGREDVKYHTIDKRYLQCNFNNKIENGLQAEYFDNITWKGKPILLRKDEVLKFDWTLYSPDEKLMKDFYSVRWTGKITSPKTGIFNIGLVGNDGFKLYLNNQLLIDKSEKKSFSKSLAEYSFEANKESDIKVEFFEPVGNAHINLVWNADLIDSTEIKIAEAVHAASNGDVAVIIAGIDEGEFMDRAFLHLPGKQEELIKRIASTGKPTVVLIVGGSAVTMSNWMDSVQSIMCIWYPGDEGGNAVAKVLFGDANPSGKLPITFPLAEGQLPMSYIHRPTGRGDDYIDLSGKPLFPFGYGISYTQFDYSQMKLNKSIMSKIETCKVSLILKNTGPVDGAEVVQLYIRDEIASVVRPVLELKSFQKVCLKAGETKEITFDINPKMLSFLSKEMKEVIEPGEFRIMIGSSSMDLRLKETLTVVE